MDFNLTKQQEMVRTTVKAFAADIVAPKAAEVDANDRFPVETVELMAKYGMLGIPFPTEYEGAGGDTLSYIITVEELSRACATTGVIVSAHTSLCINPIYQFGTPEQKAKYLPDLCAGRKLGAFGLTEPNAGTDAAGQQTVAELVDGKWILNGSKVFITNGGYADVFVVFAMTDKSKGVKGITAFIVEKDFKGFSIGKTEHKLGIRGSSTTELIFENCEVPAENLLGSIGKGFSIAMQTLDGGRIGIAAQALGIAQGAFDEAIKYSKERKQFGKPISKNQGLQWMMADMKVRLEAARHLVYHAACLKDEKKPFGTEAAMAKLYAAEAAMYITEKAVQIHGGYGYTREYPVERMMRDAKITEIYEGTSEVQRMVIAGSILK